MKLRDKLFQDETGKYVVGQPPNELVYIIIVAAVVRILSSGVMEYVSTMVFYASIFAWAFLELRYGKSLVRKIMGGLALVWLIVIWTLRA